mgnify:CR=1 FL=1
MTVSTSSPAFRPWVSLMPVTAAVMSNTLITELPWLPAYRLSPPQGFAEKDGGVDVLLKDNAPLHADMVVLAIGVTPDTALAKARRRRHCPR